MKKLLFLGLFISLNYFNSFSMQQDKLQKEFNQDLALPTLSKDIWSEIVKYGINKNAKTEKEIFQVMDTIRQLDKEKKKIIDDIVATQVKIKNKANYNYVDFKNDIMQDILIERAKKSDNLWPSRLFFYAHKSKIYLHSLEAQALNWGKKRVSIDENYKDFLNRSLITLQIESDIPSALKKLNFGSCPANF